MRDRVSLRRAMIFAAGRGERMRPLTDTTPKPLLVVGGKPLIEWHLEKLAAIGIERVVINTSHLAGQFPLALGDGSRWNLAIDYIDEGPVPLETGGGMLNALSLLGKAPFLLVNGDIWLDMDFSTLAQTPQSLAHLVMVANPAHVANGDFAIEADGTLVDQGPGRLTYSGIGVYRAELFDGWPLALGDQSARLESPPRFPLAPLLRNAMRQRRISGEFFAGRWVDVGTPQRLADLDTVLRAG
ncbi:MAG: nucleotidyltransferase family protein [Dokdonella sp.]|uniref:N-acetylmuramate alpha-1-phosphate uridylyltransferase MurU n=1 Tax=Dokdonella sp. TaxID=2291710 RepID=UPI003BB01E04